MYIISGNDVQLQLILYMQLHIISQNDVQLYGSYDYNKMVLHHTNVLGMMSSLCAIILCKA